MYNYSNFCRQRFYERIVDVTGPTFSPECAVANTPHYFLYTGAKLCLTQRRDTETGRLRDKKGLKYYSDITHGAEPFLRSRQLCSYSRTSQQFYGTRRFITVFTRVLHWSLS
jgi:hypothetical protein